MPKPSGNWYCTECGHGPMRVGLNGHCVNCHKRGPGGGGGGTPSPFSKKTKASDPSIQGKETDKEESTLLETWYCKKCGHGPMTIGIDDRCVNCGKRGESSSSPSDQLDRNTLLEASTLNRQTEREDEKEHEDKKVEEEEIEKERIAAENRPDVTGTREDQSSTNSFIDASTLVPTEKTGSRLADASTLVPSNVEDLQKVVASLRLPSPEPHDEDDSTSVMSVIAPDVSQSNVQIIIRDFTNAVLEASVSWTTHPLSSSLRSYFQRLVEARLKRFAANLASETPKSVEFRSRRNVVNVVLRRRGAIIHDFLTKRYSHDSPIPVDDGNGLDFDGSDEEEEAEIENRFSAWLPTMQTQQDHEFTNEADESQKYLEKWDSEDIASYDEDITSYDEDAASYDEDFSGLEMREYEAIRNYLLRCQEFNDLCSDIEIFHRKYCYDMMNTIQQSISLSWDHSEESLRSDTFIPAAKTQVQSNWAIRQFVQSYDGSLRDLRDCLVLTGDSVDAQMTTVGQYLHQTWPRHPEALISELNSHIFGTPLPMRSQVNGSELLIIEILDDSISVEMSLTFDLVCTISQQLAWLSSACTFAENGPRYSSSTWVRSSESPLREARFEIRSEVLEIDEDEQQLCWHTLVGDSVITSGFPIANRTLEDKGLEIPLDVMAALGGMSLAVDFGDGFILKGDEFLFIPVARKDDHVQWHLHDSAIEGTNEPSARIKLDAQALRSTKAFLGWAIRASIYAGTENIQYDTVKSSLCPKISTTAISPSSATIGFAKIASASLTFTANKRNFSPFRQKKLGYSDVLHALANMKVVLYDTVSQRGSMIDAERATLMILHHMSKKRPDYFKPENQIHFAHPDIPNSVHSAMCANGKVTIRDDIEPNKGETEKVPFSKLVTRLKEALTHLSSRARKEYNSTLHMRDVGIGRRSLYGFDYMGVVDSTWDFDQHPLRATLMSDCGQWPEFCDNLNTTVLFGRDLPEIILPRADCMSCPGFRSLPRGKSLLAVDARIIHKCIEDCRSPDNLWRLTRTDLTWIIAAQSPFASCSSLKQSTAKCDCDPIQEIKGVTKAKKLRQIDLSEDWKDGAVVFGKSRHHLQKKHKRDGEIEPHTPTSNSNTITIPDENIEDEVYRLPTSNSNAAPDAVPDTIPIAENDGETETNELPISSSNLDHLPAREAVRRRWTNIDNIFEPASPSSSQVDNIFSLMYSRAHET